MYAIDFEYDGQYLSDYGFIICDFNFSKGANNVDAGSNITFNKVLSGNGKKYSLSGAQYEECITTSFDICKNPDIYDDLRITDDEYRKLIRWLNRREYLKFRVIDDEKDTCYYEASFNIQKINIREILYGIELTMETNSPFGYGLEQSVTWDITDVSKIYKLNDMSDEIGYTYPSMKITCKDEGDLHIYNEATNCTTIIKNCSNGEVITIDGTTQIITTSSNTHHIYNDFNFEFFKITNTINNRINNITISIPCQLEIRYTPIIKGSL